MKKLLATLLASTMALTAMGGLVACGGDDEKPEVPATGLTLNKTEVTIAPDGSAAVMAALTPANATTTVQWTSSNEKVATAGPGAAQNKNCLIYGQDTGTAVITATVGKVKQEVHVTVTEWTRFMFVGNMSSWNATDASEAWLFKQDENDKHLWTFDYNITGVLPDGGIKIVAAAKVLDSEDPNYGKVVGLGWDGGYNLGIDTKNVDESGKKKQAIDSEEGVLNIVNDGGSGNINIANADLAGKYRFTLRTKNGGSFDSLSYKRIGDAE